MSKKKQIITKTTNSQIKAALHRLFLRSRERASALRRDSYTCQKCSAKQSVAKGKQLKVNVHHKSKEIQWQEIIDYIRKQLLVDSEQLITLCKKCHLDEHRKETNSGKQ